jgi:sugar phosphate isomerase/epimerase
MPAASLSLAMSTSWRARRHRHLAPVFDAIQALGFTRVELNSLTPGMVAELPSELARTGLVVPSIHHPCPWPVDGAGRYLDSVALPELSSPDPDARSAAVAAALGTMRLAQAVGACAVILHLGWVKVSIAQPDLFALLREGRHAEYEELRRRALAERGARKSPHLQAALTSIRELGGQAARLGVDLGVETRDGYHEVPDLDEFEEVFATTAGLPVRYWHDVGHAEKQGHLGLGGQEAFLHRYGGRLLGVHLHDAILDHDHYAPGKGEIDLGAVAELLPAGVLRTLELAERESVADVEAGVGILRRLGLT